MAWWVVPFQVLRLASLSREIAADSLQTGINWSVTVANIRKIRIHIRCIGDRSRGMGTNSPFPLTSTLFDNNRGSFWKLRPPIAKTSRHDSERGVFSEQSENPSTQNVLLFRLLLWILGLFTDGIVSET
jgi:hypothetical protein